MSLDPHRPEEHEALEKPESAKTQMYTFHSDMIRPREGGRTLYPP
jgi:hypothetical protein